MDELDRWQSERGLEQPTLDEAADCRLVLLRWAARLNNLLELEVLRRASVSAPLLSHACHESDVLDRLKAYLPAAAADLNRLDARVQESCEAARAGRHGAIGELEQDVIALAARLELAAERMAESVRDAADDIRGRKRAEAGTVAHPLQLEDWEVLQALAELSEDQKINSRPTIERHLNPRIAERTDKRNHLARLKAHGLVKSGRRGWMLTPAGSEAAQSRAKKPG